MTTEQVTRVIEIDVKTTAAAAKNLQDMAAALKKTEEQAKKTGDNINNFLGGVGTAIKGFIAAYAFEKLREGVMYINELADAAKVLSARMEQVTKNADSQKAAFSEIVRISVAQGREMDGVAKLYEKVARNAENLGITQKGVSVVTEGFAASLRLSGTTTQEANAAMLQFAQALASGKLQGDEFRSILENNSVFMYELAKAAGVTMGGLRQMSKDGKLDSEFLREAMLKMGEDGRNMLQRLMDNASKLPQTFAQAKTGVVSSLTDLLGALTDTAGKSEGIFTRIAKKISEYFRGTAQTLRDQAVIERSIAEALGKKVAPEEAKTPRESERVMDLMASRSHWEKELAKARAERDVAALNGMSTQSKEFDKLTEKIRRYEGTVRGFNLLLSEVANKDAGDGATLVAGKPVKKTPEAPKYVEPDIIDKEIQRLKDLKEAGELAAEGLGRYAVAAEQAIKLTSITSEDERTWSAAMLRKLAKELDAKDAAEKAWKDFKADTVATFRQDQEDTDRARAKMRSDLGRMEGYTAKESAFEWLKKESEALQGLIDYYTAIGDPGMVAKLEKAGSAIEKLYAKRAQKEIDDAYKDSADIFARMADTIVSSTDRMSDAILDFVTTGKAGIGDFVEFFLRSMAKMTLTDTLNPLVQAGSSAASDFLRDLFASKSANGNIFNQSGLVPFAKGGIIDRPTAFTYGNNQRGLAGEAGTEAIMPVQRDSSGRLGLSTAPVNVIINNNAPVRVSTEERTGTNGAKEILVMVEEAVSNSMASGRFDTILSHNFGVSRIGR